MDVIFIWIAIPNPCLLLNRLAAGCSFFVAVVTTCLFPNRSVLVKKYNICQYLVYIYICCTSETKCYVLIKYLRTYVLTYVHTVRVHTLPYDLYILYILYVLYIPYDLYILYILYCTVQ